MSSNPGNGALFQNKRKEKPNQPDYTGNACCPHCQTQVDLAGWKKQTRNGDPYLSLAVKVPQPREDAPRTDDDFDSTPF